MSVAAIAALCVLVGMAGGLVTAVRAAPLPLPEDHERRLAAGEIILLDTLAARAPARTPRGERPSPSCARRWRAVWSILVDYPGHPRFYPRLVSAEVLKASEGHALVRYVAAIGLLSFTFHMDKYQDARAPPHRVAARAGPLQQPLPGELRLLASGSA